MREITVKEWMDNSHLHYLYDEPEELAVLRLKRAEKIKAYSGIVDVVRQNGLTLEQAEVLLDAAKGRLRQQMKLS